MRRVGAARLLVLALLLPGLPGIARSESLELDPRVRGEAGASYRSWDLSDSTGSEASISQVFAPFSATVPFGPSFDMLAYGAYASTSQTIDDEDYGTLKGVTDFRLKGFWRPTERAFLSVGVNLPVGKQTLQQGTFEAAGRVSPAATRGRPAPLHEGVDDGGHHEVEVAQNIWSPLLGFRAKSMSQGLDIDLSAGTAFPLSPKITLGVGAGAQVKGEYDFVETPDGIVTFKPAGEFSASLGLDVRPSDDLLFRLDVAGRAFGDDEQDGEKVFHSSPQIEIDALLVGRSSSWNWLLRARDVAKGDDEILSESANGELLRTSQKSVDSFWAVGEAYRKLGNAFALGAFLEYGLFGESDLTLSDGNTLSVGPGARIGRAEATHLLLRGAYLTGTAEDGRIDLSGLDVSATMLFKF